MLWFFKVLSLNWYCTLIIIDLRIWKCLWKWAFHYIWLTFLHWKKYTCRVWNFQGLLSIPFFITRKNIFPESVPFKESFCQNIEMFYSICKLTRSLDFFALNSQSLAKSITSEMLKLWDSFFPNHTKNIMYVLNMQQKTSCDLRLPCLKWYQ